MKLHSLAFATVALVSSPSIAQSVIKAAQAESQAVIERDDKGFNQCGVRVVLRDDAGATRYYYDVRLKVSGSSGLIEVGRLQLTEAQVSSGKGLPPSLGPAPNKFWIAKDTDSAPLVPTRYMDSERVGLMMAMSPFGETVRMIEEIAKGGRAHFVARYPNYTGTDRVISFAAPLATEDGESLRACLSRMLPPTRAHGKRTTIAKPR